MLASSQDQRLDRYRPNRKELRRFYASNEWRRARAVALYLAGESCSKCGARRFLEAHHAVPLRASWAARSDQRNIVILCRDCHRKETTQERREW